MEFSENLKNGRAGIDFTNKPVILNSIFLNKKIIPRIIPQNGESYYFTIEPAPHYRITPYASKLLAVNPCFVDGHSMSRACYS